MTDFVLQAEETLKLKKYFCAEPKMRSLSKKKGNVIFTFDGGWETQYSQAYKILSKKQFPASISVIPSLVGKPTYVSEKQLEELHENGWDLLNHTYSHVDLSRLSSAEQLSQINKARDWLNNRCYTEGSSVLVYPYGNFNPTTLQLLKSEQFVSARSLLEGFEIDHPDNPYVVRVKSLTPDLQIEHALHWIKKANDEQKTVIFVLQKLDSKNPDPNGMSFDPKKLQEIVDYIAKQKNIQVITYTEWLSLSKK